MNLLEKLMRFVWRTARNAACVFPVGCRWLFPQSELAARFGRADAEYAWRVFKHHFDRLQDAGFSSVDRILEIGPGRNLGTALLWWAYCSSKRNKPCEVVCWDVFKNASPEGNGYWADLAGEIIDMKFAGEWRSEKAGLECLQDHLRAVSERRMQPQIDYRVEPLSKFEAYSRAKALQFDLIYSQASIEHIWHIEEFWDAMGRLTRFGDGGWHSHRIDLADHGRRETNYIEMLEWSSPAYWLTLRFVPGATNRWRAYHHLVKMQSLGMKILDAKREVRNELPIPLSKVTSAYRKLGEEELRTAALDVVAIMRG
jgi:hypothetical protein